MDSPSLNTLMEPLQEPELAQANLDLASWILQDDEAQLGFCQGAKEMHSSISGEIGHASPPFVTSGDISDMDLYNSDWSQSLNFADCFVDDLKSLANRQDYVAGSNNTTAAVESVELGRDVVSPQGSFDIDQVNNLSDDVVVDIDQVNNLSDDVVVDNPVPLDPLLHWTGGIPMFVTPTEEVALPAQSITVSAPPAPSIAVSAPQVISVPISAAVVQKEMLPVYRTVTVPAKHTHTVTVPAKHTNAVPAPVMVFKTIPSTVLSQPGEPPKVVINLRRVSLNQKTSAALAPPPERASSPAAPRTLREVLSSQTADEELKDLLTIPPSPAPHQQAQPSIQVDYSHEDFVDVEFKEEPLDYEEISIVSPGSESYDTEMTYEELTSDDGISMLSPAASYTEIVASPASSVSSYPSSPSLKAPKTSGRKARASSFSPLEKKQRKKEQNKRAALRYRQKKKEEEDYVLAVLQKEEERQDILREKYNGLLMEMKLMKKLMKDVLAKRKAM